MEHILLEGEIPAHVDAGVGCLYTKMEHILLEGDSLAQVAWRRLQLASPVASSS